MGNEKSMPIETGRETVLKAVESITPFDELERKHKEDTVTWIESGAEIFRITKPDVPKQHLVSYVVPVDLKRKSVLLVDHRKALLWLPAGGHVEKNENPHVTAEREVKEELDVDAKFVYADPFFITQTVTVGITAGHTDVSLWYVVSLDKKQTIKWDTGEFNGVGWFTFDEIDSNKDLKLDPHFRRFLKKLESKLD